MNSSFVRLFVVVLGLGLLGRLTLSARTEIPNGAQPQLAVAADGRVWLVYGQAAAASGQRSHQGDHHAGSGHGPGAGHATGHDRANTEADGAIFVACSDDRGATFGPAIKVAALPNLVLGMRRGPRIAVHGPSLTVTIVSEELTAFHSSDAGRTWSGPVTINDVPTSANEGLHDLAAAPDGRLFATWLDQRNGQMELWGAESSDGGATWSKNEQIYRSPGKSICECCHPNALFDAEGNLAVMWRNFVDGSRDLWMATRAPGAKTFSPAKKLGEGTWKLDACPMDGGKIVTFGDGKFGAVWQREGEVFLVQPDAPEIPLGKGKQPVAVARGGESLIVWQQDSNLVLVRKLGEPPVLQASNGRFASMVPLADRKGAVLAYERVPTSEKSPAVVVDQL